MTRALAQSLSQEARRPSPVCTCSIYTLYTPYIFQSLRLPNPNVHQHIITHQTHHSRRRHQRNGPSKLLSCLQRELHRSLVPPRHLHPHSSHRRRLRLRPRRWLRVSSDVRHPVLHRERHLRSARDQARHHPRRRRFPAPDPRRWQEQGYGAYPHWKELQR